MASTINHDNDDYEVYPTGRIDNALSIKPMILSLTLRFNDVLDADKLHSSLCALLATGDWRRLGGRLRSPAKEETSKLLKIVTPKVYTEERPAVAYSHADHSSMAIAAHPLGKDLPALNGNKATLYHSSEHFREFAAAKELPDTLDGFLAAGGENMPVLWLRVTNFADATLVAIAVPHILMDAMALGELLHSWSLVLAGKGEEVPPVLHAKDDILYDAADPALEKEGEAPWILQAQYLVGFSFFVFVVRFLWAVITELKIESRIVLLPKHALDKMRAKAIEDVVAAQESSDPAAAWVSEGDVLFAWACRIVSLGQGGSPRPLNAHNALNMRNRIPETTPPSETGGVFARNFITLSYMPVSPAEARGPLGLVAAKYRAALSKQTTAEQALWTLRAARASADAGKDANIICGEPPTGELLSMTNWLKADLVGNADFSPAVVKGVTASQPKDHKPGRLVYVHSQLHARSPVVRNTLGAIGKDQTGNVWLQGFFPKRTWDAFQKELDEINEQ